jgi:hypothetical protein
MKVPVFSYFVQIVHVIPFDPFSNHVYVVVQDGSLFFFFPFYISAFYSFFPHLKAPRGTFV